MAQTTRRSRRRVGRSPARAERRYTITEAAELLDRSPHTLRAWDRNESMPARLRPKRDERGHRYWTDALITEIKQWIEANNFHPGSGLSYQPTPEQLHSHIDKIRIRAQEKTNAHDKVTETLRALVRQALDEYGVPPAQVLIKLPSINQKLVDEYGAQISLAEAVRIVSEELAR